MTEEAAKHEAAELQARQEAAERAAREEAQREAEKRAAVEAAKRAAEAASEESRRQRQAAEEYNAMLSGTATISEGEALASPRALFYRFRNAERFPGKKENSYGRKNDYEYPCHRPAGPDSFP